MERAGVMANYIIRVTVEAEDGNAAETDEPDPYDTIDDTPNFHMVEASSMREAISGLGLTRGKFEVWTLASSAVPKVFHLRTETRVVLEEADTED
jgi:hypothetical protein